MQEPPAVQVFGLTKSFREGERTHRVLEGIDFRMERGERVALLGASGSGKSTLLDLIGGLEPPDAGEIHVAGTRIDTLSEHARTLFRRRHLGFVFQAFHLIATLTVLENVLLGPDLDGRQSPKVRSRALGLLERLGLSGREHSFPDVLSGGERQRVALVRALVHRPQLVLADEPTGNLDAATASEVLSEIFELCTQEQGSLLLVTHSLDAARRCQRIVRMEDLKSERA